MDKEKEILLNNLLKKGEKIKQFKELKDKPIGRVVMIPNEFTIVVERINKDIEISTDSRIIIYERGREIINPDGTFLGYFDFVKAKLDVVEVYPEYFICKDERIVKVNKFNAALSLNPFFSETSKVEYRQLPINYEENQGLKINNPNISIGDPVKLA